MVDLDPAQAANTTERGDADEAEQVEHALSPPTVRNIAVELQDLQERGISGSFRVKPGARIVCDTCHTEHNAAELEIIDFRRVEGQSDPADMAAVVAAVCQGCGDRGVVVLTYGPRASAEDADVLAALDEHEWARDHE